MSRRSSRPEYDERVCFTSASDGVLQSVEYRLLVRRDLLKSISRLLFCVAFLVDGVDRNEGRNMKLVTIRTDLLELYEQDREVLKKSGRPYVLVLRLSYKEHNYDFAVPIRSNIPAAAPKEQYFALPPRPTTRPRNRHGLHYIKMFPIKKEYQVRYRTEGNEFATMVQRIVDRNAKQIVEECQKYLDRYAAGNRPQFSTDIDFLLSVLYPDVDTVATDKELLNVSEKLMAENQKVYEELAK